MIFKYLTGSVKLIFYNCDANRVFDYLATFDIPFYSSKCHDEKSELKVPLSYKGRLSGLSEICEFSICGLPAVLIKYRKRWGIAAAAFLFFMISYFSGTVIWTVDITGNSNIDDEYIKEVLSSVGCHEGAVINNLDFMKVNNSFLAASKGISWISVNMDGTHANVEVRETMSGKKNKDDTVYNLVASESGQIERMAQIEGKPIVSINDTVEKGDLLVSGVITYHENLLRFEKASGSVFAYVTRKINFDVPFKTTEKVYTGKKITDKSAVFFKNNINLLTNYRIPYRFYDTIVEENAVYMFGHYLPAGIKTVSFREYENRTVRISENEARNKAAEALRREISKTVGNDELLVKNTTFLTKDDRISVSCELYCLADIAEPKEVKINYTERADKVGTENSKNTEQ